MSEASRLNLHELSEAQIEPLERLFDPRWPDVWKELARCFFCTLLSQPANSAHPGMQPQDLAIALTLGVAQDLGGTQPYIPCGRIHETQVRTEKVLGLLQSGKDYLSVSKECGITLSRVRNIERHHRSARKTKKS